MRKIAVWYHAKISGDGVPSSDVAIQTAAHQLGAMRESGLIASLNEFHIGVNGNSSDAMILAQLSAGSPQIHVHGVGARSEIPTMSKLRESLSPGWFVLYHHTKGITHPGEVAYDNWRQRMENACVWNWETCVRDLARGYDAAGCHWLTPERYPGMVTSPFFGGTFWWARSEYLMQLPPLPESNWANRYEAESWIGRRRPYPKVMDYLPGWP